MTCSSTLTLPWQPGFDSHLLLLIIIIIILHFSYKITFLFYFNLLNHYVTLNLELFSQIYGKYVM